ncbi:MAG TPA: anti-sigma factor [Thermoanaerobaculia bacterium]|nr:anti-sigma factor [Thermoanaerobaculia bacterium]
MTTHEEFESIAALDAIGAATSGEATALRAHLSGCIPCRRARGEFAEAALMMVFALEPVRPPAFVRTRIIAAKEEAERRFNPWWLAVAATLFLALWGWREFGIRVARERDVSQRAEIERLEHENALLNQRSEKLSAEMAALAAADTRTISLSGQEVAPSASAKVFLEPSRRRAIVFFTNLPANPNDKSYQLWIIRADQPKPMSAGVFDVTQSGNASIVIENLPVATEIKALAVTLEPRGGVEQPTNTTFYVAGNASM